MKKMSNQHGFTLVEMLACVLTLLLVSMLCGTGISMAYNSYERSLFTSNSLTLESTLDMFVGDVMRHATDIKTSEDGKVTAFTNTAYDIFDGNIIVPALSEETGGYFVIYKYEGAESTLMVGQNVYGKNMYIQDFTMTYNATSHVFEGAYVIRSKKLADVQKKCEFAFRTIAEYK